MSFYRDNPLDETVNTELIRVCKCIVPYLDRNIQRNVAVGLKFLELIYTINAFDNNDIVNEQFSYTRHDHWQQDLLRTVRSNMDPDKAHLIDAFIKFQNIKSLLNISDLAQMFSPGPNPSYRPNKEPSPTPPQPTYEAPSPEDYSGYDYFADYENKEMDFFERVAPEAPESSEMPSSQNTPSAASILEAFSPMLDDNQKQILGILSAFMNK